MLLRARFLVLALLLLIFSTSINAKLHLTLDKSVHKGIPIVVLPFKIVDNTDNEHNYTSNAPIDFNVTSVVIANNLNNCGQFTIVSPDEVQVLPRNIQEVNFGYWRSRQAEYLVSGTIVKNSNQKYTVTFMLVDLYKDNKAPSLEITFNDLESSDLRVIAHHISDSIFKKIVGVSGFFATKIAYIEVSRNKDQQMQQLIIADADGNNPQAVITSKAPLMSPKWSPNGQQIAFVSFANNRAAVNIYDSITGSVKEVSKLPGINGAPAWSPCGTKLALVLSFKGAPKIYILDIATLKLEQLTKGSAIDTEPCFDPSGKEVYFTSDRGGRPQIYRVALQNKDLVHRVTYNGAYNATPSLTPDGKHLVHQHRNKDGKYNIALLNLHTKRLKFLTNTKYAESPTIAPNGMMVMYELKGKNGSNLAAVTIDGRFKIIVPLHKKNVKEPSWSPYAA